MKSRWLLYAVIVLVLAAATLVSGPKIWPPSPDMSPTPSQLPFFMFLAGLESLVFSLGVVFILTGWPLISKAGGKGATAAYIAISWMLVSWWPHDNMHIHNGMNMAGLLVIEYTFHFTLMISALIVARWFLSVAKK